MFVDASVLMAIPKDEQDAPAHSDDLERYQSPITSPIAVVETVMSLGRQKKMALDVAHAEVMNLLKRAGVVIRQVGQETGELAVKAHATYGKGSGHPAHLNLGDCFAYAMAKQHGVPLLYKGDDFAETDLA